MAWQSRGEADTGKPSFYRDKARRGVAGILRLCKGIILGGLKIKDLINEGLP